MFDVQLEPTIIRPFSGRSRTELTGVNNPGAVSEVPISKNAEIKQLQIKHVAGSGAYTINIFSDAALTDNIFSAISNTGEDFFVSDLNLIFQNTDNPQNSTCYIKINPLSGLNHAFKIALFFNKL